MTQVFTSPKAIFENRRDAGRQLAVELKPFYRKPVVVLAIPNGGVPIALEIAGALDADLDVIVCRKIPLPFTPEAGFGAIADNGTIMLNDELVQGFGLTPQQIDFEANKVRLEIKKRSMLYRGEQPLTALRDKIVIIIDDGLASGITMTAAVASVRQRHPREVIAAVPVASQKALDYVRRAGVEVVTCAVGTGKKFAVADFYRNWHDINTNDVVRWLDNWRREQRYK